MSLDPGSHSSIPRVPTPILETDDFNMYEFKHLPDLYRIKLIKSKKPSIHDHFSLKDFIKHESPDGTSINLIFDHTNRADANTDVDDSIPTYVEGIQDLINESEYADKANLLKESFISRNQYIHGLQQCILKEYNWQTGITQFRKMLSITDRFVEISDKLDDTVDRLRLRSLDDTVDRLRSLDDTVDRLRSLDDTVDRLRSLDDTVDRLRSLDDTVDRLRSLDDTVDRLRSLDDTVDRLRSLDDTVDRLKNIHNNQSLIISDLYTKIVKRIDAISERPENWDEFGAEAPNKIAVSNSKKIIKDWISKVIYSGYTWKIPYISSDEEGFITLEWYNDNRQLHIEIGDIDSEYIKFERTDTGSKITDGSLDTDIT